MIGDPVLTLAWLVLAHLVADFVLQSNRIARDKFGTGPRAWRGLADHLAGVAVCLVPIPLAFGLRGLAFFLIVIVGHAVIDRAKAIWTRHAEAVAIVRAHREHEGAAPPDGLGSAWTPVPAALFVADQLAHALVIGWAWAVWLAGAPLTDAWRSAAGALVGGWDQAGVARIALVGVVLADLVILNVRAGAMFVATLVNPREVVTGHRAPGQPDENDAATGGTGAHVAAPRSPARIGATIGVLERLLIVAFVLTGAEAAIGFVVAAKTLARFKQLDDRPFAEYYLLGTLASVSVALATGLLALAALR